MSLERDYQAGLKKRIKKRFPGCMILKNDEQHIQGIPDLLILWKNRWAMLEVKRSAESFRRPNQTYYVKRLNGMGFASFIYPENEEEVLDAVQRSFSS